MYSFILGSLLILLFSLESEKRNAKKRKLSNQQLNNVKLVEKEKEIVAFGDERVNKDSKIRIANRFQPPQQYAIRRQQQQQQVHRILITKRSELSKSRFEFAKNNDISYNKSKKNSNLIVELTNINADNGTNLVVVNDFVESQDIEFELTAPDSSYITNNNNNNTCSSNTEEDLLLEYLIICLSKIDTSIQYYGKFNFIEVVKRQRTLKQMNFQLVENKKAKNDLLLLKSKIYNNLQNLFGDNKFSFTQQSDIIKNLNLFARILNPTITPTMNLSLNDMSQSGLSCKKDLSIMFFDCCPNGDHVYVFDEKDSHQTRCPNILCGAERYNKCTYPNCPSAYSSCENHYHQNYKTPKKEIGFRSVIMLLHDLCSSKLFRGLIKYNSLKEKYSSRSENMYSDVMQSPHVLKHLREMATNREDNILLPPDERDRNKIIVPIDLILMEYYDGAQLFKSTVKEFVPLMISILNLPPTLRKVVNLGMFTISIFTGGKRDPNNPNISNSEQFIIGKCFVDELLYLDKDGIWVKDVDDNSIIYHVKARLISHVYDTAELQHMCQFQGVQSYTGCALCRTIQGKYSKELGASCFLGHRIYLPMDNVLRYKGQKLECCPPNFYAPNELIENNFIPDLKTIKKKNWNIFNWKNEQGQSTILINDWSMEKKVNEKFQEEEEEEEVEREEEEVEREEEEVEEEEEEVLEEAEIESDEDEITMPYTYTNENSTAKFLSTHKEINKLMPCDSTNDQQLKILCFLKSSSKFSFFHEHVCPIEEFQDYLYYHYCDYRQQKEYQRVTNILYFYDNLKRFHSTINNKHYRGIKGNWPYWRLPYASIAHDCCFCPFHTFKNIALNVFKNFKGERCKTTIIKSYCYQSGFHPSLTNSNNEDAAEENANTANNESNNSNNNNNNKKKKKKTINAVWVLEPFCKIMIDNWLEAILLPSGIDEEFRIKGLFDLTDSKKGVNVIRILITYMEIIVICIRLYQPDYPTAYLYYHIILSEVITDISSTYIPRDADKIKVIFYKTAELLAIHEGMYPPSESLFAYHQLIDMVGYLNVLGPIRNWWNLPAERMLSHIKSHKISGAPKFYKTMFNKQIEEEQGIIKKIFHPPANNLSDRDDNVSQILSKYKISCSTDSDNKDGSTIQYTFCGNKNVIITKKDEKSTVDFTNDPREKDLLYELVVSSIVKLQFNNKVDEACKHNKLVRLYYSFISFNKAKLLLKKGNDNFDTFINLLVFVSDKDDYSSISKWLEMNPERLKDDSASNIFSAIMNGQQLYKQDLEDCTYFKNLQQIKLKEYEKAEIGENKFKARGKAYHNFYNQLMDKFDEENSILKKVWYHEDNISSWCKFFQERKTKNQIIEIEDYYAQINFFGKVKCEINEPIFENLNIAAITARKATPFKLSSTKLSSFKFSRKIAMIGNIDDERNSLISHFQFVDINNIYPTPIGIIGIAYSEQNKEILYMNESVLNKVNAKRKNKKEKSFTTSDAKLVNTLILIDLIPESLEMNL
jgi:hypothetical protein